MLFNFKDQEYPMSDTLRVAYKMQSAFGHKPYMSIFSSMGELPVEKQIQILFIAFDMANPGKTTQLEFTEYCLDNLGMQQFMDALEELMDSIMYRGLTPEERARKKDPKAEENLED